MRIVWGVLLVALVSGCGGGSSSDDFFPLPASNATVTGNAAAPAGAVATFEPKTALEVALSLLVPTAHAAITGLDPIPGATVELIRVDNAGAQEGEVLAETTTSTTGNYTLTLPAGTRLAGNLVVRITGNAGKEMRAQVVQRRVNITPVSEYVLQRFVDSGADLEALETAAVVKLGGYVETFDVAATGNLDDMIAALEEETGAFVDNQIELITTPPAEAASWAGNYRNTSFSYALHDDDSQYGVGTFGSDVWSLVNLQLSEKSAGEMWLDIDGNEQQGYAGLTAFDNGGGFGYELTFNTELEQLTERFAVAVNANGVLAMEDAFYEGLDTDTGFGWRFPPKMTLYQKAANDNIFINLYEAVAVRYRLIDTNGDTVTDTLDPDQRDGDEVFRGLEVLVEKPEGATAQDVTGDFGRVYLSATAQDTGELEIASEHNILNFDGVGLLDIGVTTRQQLTRSAAGAASYAVAELPSENDLAYVLAADGDFTSIGGEAVDGFINNSFNFITFNEYATVDDANPEDEQVAEVEHGFTLAVKLPASTHTLTGREYRLVALGVEADGSALALNTIGFGATLVMDTETTATLNGVASSVLQTDRDAEVSVTHGEFVDQATTVSQPGNGELTLSLVDGDGGTLEMQGYLSEDGSIGLLTSRYIKNGDTDPAELGLVVLLEK